MEATLKSEFDIQAVLIKGGGGIFDVVVDGEMIYSKHQTGEFPQNEAIVKALRERAG